MEQADRLRQLAQEMRHICEKLKEEISYVPQTRETNRAVMALNEAEINVHTAASQVEKASRFCSPKPAVGDGD